MKNIKIFFITVLIALFYSCASQNKLIKSVENDTGVEIEYVIPLNKSYLVDNDEYLRNISNGVSSNWNTAKNIALTECRAGLIQKINGKIKTAMENYGKQYSVNGTNDIGNIFQQYTITYAENTMTNMYVVDEYTTRNSITHDFTYWVAMEIKKEDIINYMVDSIDNLPKSVKEKTEYDRAAFIKYLNDNIF